MKLIMLLILLVVCGGAYIYSTYGRKKGGRTADIQKTVQEFMNVSDIEQSFIYTRDNYLIGFLQISGRKTDLLSNREKAALTQQLTAEVSTVNICWQLLAVSQPEDNSALIYQYQEMMDTQNATRKKLLREAIRYQNELLLSGENVERKFYIKLWEYRKEGAEQELMEHLQQFAKCFDISGYSSEILGKEEVIRLCNLVHNPAAILYEGDEISRGMPRLAGKEDVE